MPENKLFSSNGITYIYNKTSKDWELKGDSRVIVFESVDKSKFRIVSRLLTNASVLINTFVFGTMSVRIDAAMFVQWADKRQLYGILFDSEKTATNFTSVLGNCLEVLSPASSNNGKDRLNLLPIPTAQGLEHQTKALFLCIGDYNRFFGMYDQTYDKLPHVPTMLRQGIEFLEARLDIEYLFRVSLPAAKNDALNKLKKGEGSIDGNSDPDVVAEYLKFYFNSVKPILQISNEFKSASNDEKKSEILANIIDKSPERNRQLLQVIIWLLANIGYNAEVNHMDTNILSKLFVGYLV